MQPIYRSQQASLLENIKADLLAGRRVKLQARGWSMLPMIWNDRDNLILAPIDRDKLSVGQIVFAQTGSGRYIVHRIVRIVGTRVELRGDGNPYQEEYVHPQTIIGELVAVERKGKLLKKGDCLWTMTERLWPRSGNLRRVLLYVYKRLFVMPSVGKASVR